MAATVSSPASTSYRPAGSLNLATALAPYAGPWDTRLAAHLLRRAGFGGSPTDVARIAGMSMHDAVESFINFAPMPSLTERPSLENDAYPVGMRPAMMSPEERKAFNMQQGKLRRQDAIAMQAWWLDRMIATPNPLQEKMTLFWHGHFTTSYQKTRFADGIVDQNNLFREYALGNIHDLTLHVSQDPAMLRYLDNNLNVKAHPNENYARELMELFTLGIGNYTEADVRESARAFTGWSVDRRAGTFTNNAYQHDDGQKTFLGQTGNFAGNNIVDIIFQQPAAARLFANRLLSFFLYSDPEPELVEAFAAILRKNNYVLKPAMSILLQSNVFYSDRAYRALVKSPVEFVVGSYQLYGIPKSDVAALGALRRMSQILFYPPNVKGWDGGAAWLNSQTLLTRENFASSLQTKMTDAPWLAQTMQKMQAQPIAQTLTQTILQGDVSAASSSKLIAYLNGSDVAADSQLSGENADQRVRGAAYLTMAMPAYQLA